MITPVKTVFTKLNEGWNAEPNAPDANVVVDGADVLLYFDLNPFQFPQFEEGQRAHLRFEDAWRYRLGATNDEGWYHGQCRFSRLAPAWGEFYEVVGDLLLSKCPDDWRYVAPKPGEKLRHFLFYLRDDTFECDARAYRLDLGCPREAPMDPEPTPEQWRQYLANSLSFLERLTDLNAPECVIEDVRRTARDRMAKLPPSDADAVLRAWPRGAKLLSSR